MGLIRLSYFQPAATTDSITVIHLHFSSTESSLLAAVADYDPHHNHLQTPSTLPIAKLMGPAAPLSQSDISESAHTSSDMKLVFNHGEPLTSIVQRCQLCLSDTKQLVNFGKVTAAVTS